MKKIIKLFSDMTGVVFSNSFCNLKESEIKLERKDIVKIESRVSHLSIIDRYYNYSIYAFIIYSFVQEIRNC